MKRPSTEWRERIAPDEAAHLARVAKVIGGLIDFIEAATSGPLSGILHLFKAYGPIGGFARLRDLFGMLGKKFSGFAAERFDTVVPIRCGPYAVRARLKPVGRRIEGLARRRDADRHGGAPHPAPAGRRCRGRRGGSRQVRSLERARRPSAAGRDHAGAQGRLPRKPEGAQRLRGRRTPLLTASPPASPSAPARP